MAAHNAFDLQIKLLMIGDSDAGKTQLLLRYANDSFSPTFVTTIGIDFKIKNIRLDGQRIKLQIWDTAGQERFRTITTSYFRGAQGIMLVYDICNRNSFISMRNWHAQVMMHADANVNMILVGNNCEQNDLRAISYDEGVSLAKEFRIPFFEASARQNLNVENAFVALTTAVKNRLVNPNVPTPAPSYWSYFGGGSARTQENVPSAPAAPSAPAPYAAPQAAAAPAGPAAVPTEATQPPLPPLPPSGVPDTAEHSAGKDSQNADPDGSNDPVYVDAERIALEQECDTITGEVALAPSVKEALLQRDAIKKQYDAAEQAGQDYTQVAELGQRLEGHRKQCATLAVSEEAYDTLASRHAALVTKATAKCVELLTTKQAAALKTLGTKLTALRALDVSVFRPAAPSVKAPASTPAAPFAHDADKLAQLRADAAVLFTQMAGVPVRRDMIQRRDALQGTFDQLRSAAEVDFGAVGDLMLQLEALEIEAAALPLSADGYMSLRSRHKALVQGVVSMCGDLARAKEYAELKMLAVLLSQLRALDVSSLPGAVVREVPAADGEDASANDPVWPHEEQQLGVQQAHV